MRRSAPALLALVLVSIPQAAWAQNAGLSGLLLRFFAPSNPVILADTGHSAHFGSQPNAQATLTELNRGIAAQLATFPLGSSSGGFAYTFDPALGVFSRATDTFGPVFSERALTSGKGKFNIGVTYQRSTFDSFEGQNLRDGDITLFLTHQDLNGDNSNLDPFFEGDLIQADLLLDVRADTIVANVNYGVTDRLDVGMAIPYLRIEMQARIRETIRRFATDTSPFLFHIHTNGEDVDFVEETGAAEGIGDLVMRAKYLLKRAGSGGLALGLDLRLPTADEVELLGSGATQAKLYFVASGPGNRFSPHINVGYTFSRGGSGATGKLPNEINYVGGFDAALTKRLTLTADVIGRTLLNTNRVVKVEKEHTYRHGNGGPVLTTTVTDFVAEPGDLNVMLGSAGFKMNPCGSGNLLISGNVLVSQGKRGLQDWFTPVVSLDYSF